MLYVFERTQGNLVHISMANFSLFLFDSIFCGSCVGRIKVCRYIRILSDFGEFCLNYKNIQFHLIPRLWSREDYDSGIKICPKSCQYLFPEVFLHIILEKMKQNAPEFCGELKFLFDPKKSLEKASFEFCLVNHVPF